MTEDMTLYRAYLETRNAAESLVVAHHAEGYTVQFYTRTAKEQLTRAAELLGFDLVPREDKSEAA